MINSRGKRVVREAVFLPPLSLWELRTKILMKSASAPMFIRCFRNQAKVPHMLSLISNSAISASESLKRRSLLFWDIVFTSAKTMNLWAAMAWCEACISCAPYTQSKLVRCVKGRVLDDTLGIDWKISTEHANLSEKDTKHAMLKDFDSPFDINVDLYK